MSSSNAARLAPSYAPRYYAGGNRPAKKAPQSLQDLGRPQIQIVSRDQNAKAVRAWPFVLLALLVLLLAIALPLVVNTQMAQTSYAIRDMRVELAELNAQTVVLETQLNELESAPALQQKAEELGLVRAGAPGTVSITESTVTGGEPGW